MLGAPLDDTDASREIDERKTAKLASWSVQPALVSDAKGVVHVHNHALARSVLRAPEVEQNGFGVAGISVLVYGAVVFGAELLFELLSETLSERRTLSGSRNGDLQGSALYDGGIIEITKGRNIHDIAEHTARGRFFEQALVKVCR